MKLDTGSEIDNKWGVGVDLTYEKIGGRLGAVLGWEGGWVEWGRCNALAR